MDASLGVASSGEAPNCKKESVQNLQDLLPGSLPSSFVPQESSRPASYLPSGAGRAPQAGSSALQKCPRRQMHATTHRSARGRAGRNGPAASDKFPAAEAGTAIRWPRGDRSSGVCASVPATGRTRGEVQGKKPDAQARALTSQNLPPASPSPPRGSGRAKRSGHLGGCRGHVSARTGPPFVGHAPTAAAGRGGERRHHRRPPPARLV